MLTTILSILIVIIVVLLFAIALIIFRAMMYGRIPEPAGEVDIFPVDGKIVAEHLSTAIRVQTVSVSETEPPREADFHEMHRTLERLYPRLHATLKRERVNNLSLLYSWEGRAPELEPVLFCGHLDVVPFDPVTRDEWTHPPFSGDVVDNFVWGRGALDMKSSVISIMEAVEALIRGGYQPERTLYMAFGHDEEISGKKGAAAIAALLEQRGVRLAAVLDEGGAVMNALLPGVKVPVALIGIAEKGYASIELRVEGRPGHSSMPPRHTAIGVLARAIAKLENSPLPPRTGMARLMFDDLGVFLPFSMRMAFANWWLFGGSVLKRFESSPQTSAQIRTTMAATMIDGGVKDNVLPAMVKAVVNCRLMPGDTRAAVVEHVRSAIDDEAVQVILPEENGWEASQVSEIGSTIYNSLAQAVRQVFPEAATSPYLVVGATDSRYYARLCSNVFRFSPYLMDADLLKTIHGIDERISVDALSRMVGFYHLLIRSWTAVVGNP